jgi:hypothetical protein
VGGYCQYYKGSVATDIKKMLKIAKNRLLRVTKYILGIYCVSWLVVLSGWNFRT